LRNARTTRILPPHETLERFPPFDYSLIAIFVLGGASPTALSQDPSLDIAATNKADATAYRILFRQVDTYKQMSDDAKSAHQDKEYLRKVIPELIEMHDSDAPNLERLSVACAMELRAIQAEVAQAIERFHAQRLVPGYKDTGPPPELAALQAKNDAVVLRYRDTWRNTMDEDEFLRVQLEIRKRFGKTLSLATDTPTIGAR
jgi:hypothetical protein